MKRIVSFVLTLLIGFISLKIFFHYQIYEAIRNHNKNEQASVSIHYKSLSTSLWNQSVSFHNLNIDPASNQRLTIDKVSIQSAHLLGELKDFTSVATNLIEPKKIKVQNLAFNLNEPIQIAKLKIEWPKEYQKYLTELDLAYLLSDLKAITQVSADKNFMALSIHQKIHKMFQVTLDSNFSIHADYRKQNTMPLGFSNLALVNATLKIEHDTFIEKLAAHIAFEKNKTSLRIKHDLYESFMQALDETNIPFTESDRLAIQNFFEKNQSLFVQLKPLPMVDVTTLLHLNLYNPKDIPGMLNLRFTNEA